MRLCRDTVGRWGLATALACVLLLPLAAPLTLDKCYSQIDSAYYSESCPLSGDGQLELQPGGPCCAAMQGVHPACWAVMSTNPEGGDYQWPPSTITHIMSTCAIDTSAADAGADADSIAHDRCLNAALEVYLSDAACPMDEHHQLHLQPSSRCCAGMAALGGDCWFRLQANPEAADVIWAGNTIEDFIDKCGLLSGETHEPLPPAPAAEDAAPAPGAGVAVGAAAAQGACPTPGMGSNKTAACPAAERHPGGSGRKPAAGRGGTCRAAGMAAGVGKNWAQVQGSRGGASLEYAGATQGSAPADGMCTVHVGTAVEGTAPAADSAAEEAPQHDCLDALAAVWMSDDCPVDDEQQLDLARGSSCCTSMAGLRKECWQEMRSDPEAATMSWSGSTVTDFVVKCGLLSG